LADLFFDVFFSIQMSKANTIHQFVWPYNHIIVYHIFCRFRTLKQWFSCCLLMIKPPFLILNQASSTPFNARAGRVCQMVKPSGHEVRVPSGITLRSLRIHTAEPRVKRFNGDSMVIQWDLMGFHGIQWDSSDVTANSLNRTSVSAPKIWRYLTSKITASISQYLSLCAETRTV
jgi:hypothetical protein